MEDGRINERSTSSINGTLFLLWGLMVWLLWMENGVGIVGTRVPATDAADHINPCRTGRLPLLSYLVTEDFRFQSNTAPTTGHSGPWAYRGSFWLLRAIFWPPKGRSAPWLPRLSFWPLGVVLARDSSFMSVLFWRKKNTTRKKKGILAIKCGSLITNCSVYIIIFLNTNWFGKILIHICGTNDRRAEE